MKAFKDWFVVGTKKEGSEVTVQEARQMIQRKEPVILRTIPFPSETDVKMAFYPEVTTIIISLKEENPVVKAFQITEEAIYLNEIEVME